MTLTKTERFRVLPGKVQPISKKATPGLSSVPNLDRGTRIFIGVVVGILICLSYFLFKAYDIYVLKIKEYDRPYYVLFLIVAVFGAPIITSVINSVSKLFRLRGVVDEWKANEEKIEIDRVRSEAESKTLTFKHYYEEALQLASSAEDDIMQAHKCLDLAEYEYHERVFNPFWEAIEQVAFRLNSFDQRIKGLTILNYKYCEGLSGLRHTFPEFPGNARDLPRQDQLIRRWRALIRDAQKSPDFDNTWQLREIRREQRKTTEAVLAGFSSFSEAFNSLGDRIDQSIRSLEETNSLDSAKLLEQHAETTNLLATSLGEGS